MFHKLQKTQMNFYYEVKYDYPCRAPKRRDKKKLKNKNQRIKFVSLMFAADKPDYITSVKYMEFVSANNLAVPKHMFCIDDYIYALNLIGAKGKFYQNKILKKNVPIVRFKDKPIVR